MAAQVHRDNPAGRLHWILTTMRRVPSNQPLHQTLGDILSPNNPSVAHVMESIAKLAALPDQVRLEVGTLPESGVNKDRLLDWGDSVNAAIGTLRGGLHSATSGFTTHYNDGDLKSLAFCSDELRRHKPETQLEEDRLEDIRVKLAELQQILTDSSDLDPGLADLLRSHIRAMGQALDEAQLWGAGPFRAAVAETLGDMLLSPLLIARAKSDAPSTWIKISAILTAVSAALSFGTAAIQAIEAASASAPAVKVEIVTDRSATTSQIPAPARPKAISAADGGAR